MTTIDADILLNIYDDVGLIEQHNNRIPTTNDAELAFVVDEETKYGCTFGNINISGHVLLN